jgi:hypothetical protein
VRRIERNLKIKIQSEINIFTMRKKQDKKRFRKNLSREKEIGENLEKGKVVKNEEEDEEQILGTL